MPPIPTSVDSLYLVATDLLTAAHTALVDNGLKPPEHVFVAFNTPSDDCCDHLTTHVGETRAITSSRDASCAIMMESDIVVTLIGCVPTDPPFPPDAELNQNSYGFYQRAWTLYQALVCAYQANTLLPSLNGCTVVKFGRMNPRGPQGGCGRIQFTITVQHG